VIRSRVLLVLLVLLVGCGFLDTRQPLKPLPGGGCPRAVPIDPDSVLSNLVSAFACGLEGLTLYGEALSLDYSIRLDAIDAIETGSDSLDREATLNAHRIFYQTAEFDSVFLAFDGVHIELMGNTAEAFGVEYVFVGAPDSLTLRAPLRISGIANLFFREGTVADWELFLWEDGNDADTTSSLGRVYGEFAF